MLKRFLQFFLKNKLVLFLILLGSLSWSLTMVKSGLLKDFGIGFWGPNGHDGVWHIALANSLARGSWEVPVFAGETLMNYHVGFDLLLAVLNKLTNVDIPVLYFQVIPPILAVLIGALTYKFAFIFRKSKTEAIWGSFFVYFGGSFGWLLTVIREGVIGGESIFWSSQAVSTLINPPFALSLVILLLGLIHLKKPLVSTLLFGVLFEIKAYAGLLALLFTCRWNL